MRESLIRKVVDFLADLQLQEDQFQSKLMIDDQPLCSVQGPASNGSKQSSGDEGERPRRVLSLLYQEPSDKQV